MFEPHVYQGRRKALLEGLHARGLGSGLVLLPGNGESPRNYRDNAYPFRQDSTFLYYVGLALPGLAATLDLATGEARLYGDDLSMDDIIWTGPEPRVADLAARSGIAATGARGELATRVAGAQARGAALLYLPPYREATLLDLMALTGRSAEGLRSAASLDLIRAVVAQREIKEDIEVAELEAAVATTVAMHRAALATARPGILEAEVAARVAAVAQAAGGDLSFPTIATVRGATLHNHRHDGRLREGDLFLLDAGAESPSGYAGDLTTTFPVSPTFSGPQADLYEVVLAMGRAATAILKPGLPFEAAHDAACRAAIAGLRDLGLMRGDPEEALAAGAQALFFPHGLGHQMGLDVHDLEALGESEAGWNGAPRPTQFGKAFLRLGKPLAAGMVHTVEPGLYLIPELVAAWKKDGRNSQFIEYPKVEALLGLGGIRNEEDWLVTPTGARRLGPEFDKSRAALEAARCGATGAKEE